MGYGLLCEPLHGLHQLPSDADEQHPTTHVEYGESSVPDSIRVTPQGDGPADPICVTAAVPGTTGRV
jgi:hypothetical protein